MAREKHKIVAFFFILLLFGQGYLYGAAVGAADLPHLLEGIRKHYVNLPGFTVRYTREVITKSMSMLGDQIRGDLATGRMYFKPPYLLRVEQESPQSETIVSNADTFWWFIPAKRRAYQYPAREFGKELRLLSDIFRGLGQAEDSFQISMVPHDKPDEFLIELRPDPPWQEIDYINLTVSKDYAIRVVSIHNFLGGVTLFKLEGLTVKEHFDEGFFQFVPPPGVQLVVEGS